MTTSEGRRAFRRPAAYTRSHATPAGSRRPARARAPGVPRAAGAARPWPQAVSETLRARRRRCVCEAGHRHGQEPRLPAAGRALGPARDRLDRDAGAAVAAPARRPAAGRGRARRPIRAELLKGRSNYVCRRMVVQLGMRLFDPSARRRDRAPAALARRAPTTGDRAELDHAAAARTRGREVAVGPERCLRRALPATRPRCFAEEARERALEAEIVIVNHALYFADLGLRHRLRRAHRRPARARRGHLRRGPRARGRRRRVAGRAPLAARRRAPAPRLRAGLPARQRDRPGADAARARAARRTHLFAAPAGRARAHAGCGAARAARPRAARGRERCGTRSAA